MTDIHESLTWLEKTGPSSRARQVGVACLILLCILPAREAWADGISFPLVAAAGSIVLVPLTAFVVLVEGLFLGPGLRVAYRRTLLMLLAANLASLAAGIPTKMLNALIYSAILPRALAPRFREYPRAVLLGTVIYFAVTLLVEYVVVLLWCRKAAIPVRLRRAALFILLANVATYSVLAPLHYVSTRPIHDIREFTDASGWGQRPATTVYYVDSDNGHLCSILTNGQGKQQIIRDRVMDYQFIPDKRLFLYRNGANDLVLYREGPGRPILCWRTDQRFTMEHVACSPDGKIVAYLKRVGQLKPYELVLYSVESDRTSGTGITTHADEYNPEIAWSAQFSTLFLKHHERVEAITIGGDLSATRAPSGRANEVLLRCYGRFGQGHWWGGNDWGACFSEDASGHWKVSAMPGLASHIRVTGEGSSFVLADNPGLLHLARRHFGDVCFLGNGAEAVFDDGHDLYLLDVARRRVGRITSGGRFLILKNRYRREMADPRQRPATTERGPPGDVDAL